ncbi:MAG: protein of unknown function DUF302 [halophilic archaeon J07HX64]|jgi:Domain of unknown function DUF302.|nr:MAG: protein of unknown function DUF302 [halophilic archaeon J07HX64]
MSDSTAPAPGEQSSAAEDAMHTTLDMAFEDAVPFVQLEHELAEFETVQVTRVDQMVEGMLGTAVERTALVVVCHPEVARDALAIDQSLAGMLPCTTAVYETTDGEVHVHHISATKAIRDLGCAPADAAGDLEQLVDLTGNRMAEVWRNIERHADAAGEV